MLEQIHTSELSPMARKVNKDLMVGFINKDLINRCGLDVRDSIVLYDGDKVFKHAVRPDVWAKIDDSLRQELVEKFDVRYWSTGI